MLLPSPVPATCTIGLSVRSLGSPPPASPELQLGSHHHTQLALDVDPLRPRESPEPRLLPDAVEYFRLPLTPNPGACRPILSPPLTRKTGATAGSRCGTGLTSPPSRTCLAVTLVRISSRPRACYVLPAIPYAVQRPFVIPVELTVGEKGEDGGRTGSSIPISWPLPCPDMRPGCLLMLTWVVKPTSPHDGVITQEALGITYQQGRF